MVLKVMRLLDKKHNTKKPFCSVVVAAAGSSTRMNGNNKLLIDICGKPVLIHTLSILESCDVIHEIIVVTRAEDIEQIAVLCAQASLLKVTSVVAGGSTRLESVYNGVMQASKKAELIAVHDGARPFVTADIIANTVQAARKYSAAAPAIPITSTVKQAKNGIVEKTLNRDVLYEIQTPQVFEAEILKAALTNAIEKSMYISDDCMAVEALGVQVHLTEGSRENIKLTTTSDVLYAQAIYSARRNGE